MRRSGFRLVLAGATRGFGVFSDRSGVGESVVAAVSLRCLFASQDNEKMMLFGEPWDRVKVR
jgi:hypothetical protein